MTAHRNRGIVRLDEEILYRALNLGENQRVIGFRTNPVALSIEVCIEGEGLPEVAPGCEAPLVDAEPYTRRIDAWTMRGTDLAERIRALTDPASPMWIDALDSPAATLLRVLDERWDPR